MTPRGFRRSFRNPFRSRALEREVEEEHAFHLDEKTRALVARGVPEGQARRRAESDFGRRGHWRSEALRERRRGRARAHRIEAGHGWLEDLVMSVRQLRRRPGFTMGTLAVVMVGVGFAASVLAAVDAVLYRPLPFENGDRVVWLRGSRGEFSNWGVSPANWLDWKEMQRSFSAMAATRGGNTPLLEGTPEYVSTLRVESGFFRVLGIQPRFGRLLDADDDRPDAPPVAVLTYPTWATRFGADPGIIGRQITLGGQSTTVVGVLPRSFQYLDVPVWGGPEREIFRNNVYVGDRTSRYPGGYFWPVALLRDGVTIQQAQGDMDRVAAVLAETYPDILGGTDDSGPLGIRVTALRGAVTGQLRGSLLLLGGFVVLLLLLVCVNVAGLLVARALGRTRELAIRSSFGAGPLRLARETLAEVAVLAAVGGGLGIGLVALLLRLIQAAAPPGVAFLDHARLDGRVALGVAVIAVVLWALAGVLPAWRAGRADPNAMLGSGRRGLPSFHSRAGQAIVVTQVTLVTALVTGAALLLQTYASMASVDPGFQAENVHVLGYRLPNRLYATPVGSLAEYGTVSESTALADQVREQSVYHIGAEARDFVERASAALSSIPGVRAVAVTSYPPFWGSRPGYGVRALDADERAQASPSRGAYRVKWVSPNYFELLGTPVLKGRTFTAEDRPGGHPVMVVNEAFVDTYLDEVPDPLGTVVEVEEAGYLPPRDMTVVGVVKNTVHGNPLEPELAAAYIAVAQRGELWDRSQLGFPLETYFLVRTEPDADVPVGALRAVIAGMDPTLPVRFSSTLEEMRNELYAETRFWLLLLASFALVGLILAAAGTFGLLAQSVRHRTHDIGVRRALGASARDALAGVMRESLSLTTLGILVGLAGSWYLARLLASQVVGVDGLALGPVVLVVVVLLGTAVAATWIPARWASRVDPIDALRVE